jgi:putative cardiolipin synthase
VIAALRRLARSATKDLVIVTPFFVPSDADIQAYEEIVARGVRVRLLTNSLASNPGTISNSGFKRHRLAIVRAGVELHELRPDAEVKPMWETPPRVGSHLGLHGKMFIIDRETILVGSVNLDPRSEYINTEMGVHIRDSTLAGEFADRALGLMVPENAWAVGIGTDGRLRWSSDQGDLRRQPARGVGQRVADWIFGLLPIQNHI